VSANYWRLHQPARKGKAAGRATGTNQTVRQGPQEETQRAN